MPKNNIKPLTWVEIDLSAIKYNLGEIRRLAAKNTFLIPSRQKFKKFAHQEILAVIKSDAYGHGMSEMGCLLEDLGVKYFAVSDVKEGIRLREAGIKKDILLFENALPENVSFIGDYHLTPTVCTIELASALNDYAKKIKRRIHIHVEIDTGMGRLGIWHKEAFDFIHRIHQFRYLTIEGIFTHFPSADTDRAFTQQQITLLYQLVLQLDKSGLVVPFIHAANSMGLAGYHTKVLNLVRPGLMLYGLYPKDSLKLNVHLKPAMSVYSRIIFIKEIQKGRSISYNRTFIAKKNMKVATVPIGYNDGYFITLSNQSHVLIGGKRCPVIGRVTMDQILVDVSSIKNVTVGEKVTILGVEDKQSITADELARNAHTINYEIVCSLGNRLPRVYK
jgi:alanine racemase